MAGTWKAQPAQDVSITLTLQEGGDFAWEVDSKGQKQSLTGKAGFKDNELALFQEEGPPLDRQGHPERREQIRVRTDRLRRQGPGFDVYQGLIVATIVAAFRGGRLVRPSRGSHRSTWRAGQESSVFRSLY